MTLLDTFFRSAPSTRGAHRSKLSTLNRLYDLFHQRQVLSKLGKDALRDIGVSQNDAANEARRPFWDVPSTWRD